MFSRIIFNYTTLILRRQNFRNYSHFSKSNNLRIQLCTHSPLLFTATTKAQPSLPEVLLQIYKIKCGCYSTNKLQKGSFSAIKQIWKNIFGKYLLVTNIIGSGILMVFGDIIAQEIEFHRDVHNRNRYDWERVGRMFIVGALQGPLHHYVYNWMDKVMPVANFKNVMKKILIDELVMSPACIIIFFYSACFLERKTFKETNDELKEKFLFIYLIDWLLWPGAQYINFRYLETKYRVTFVNVCTALYNIFMSYVKHDYNVPV